MKNYYLFSIFFFFVLNVNSQNNTTWMLNSEKSQIQYTAKHLLHEWNGINDKVKGVFLFNDQSKIAISANIADFDSGISNRDSNALRVLNALNYPQVKFYSDKITFTSGNINFIGELDFHGKKIKKTVNAIFLNDSENISIEGSFSIVLTDFDIKLPSLMLVKMEDFADIKFKLIFEKPSLN